MCKTATFCPNKIALNTKQYSSLTQPSSSGPTPCNLHTQRIKGEVFSLDEQKSVAQCLPPRWNIWCGFRHGECFVSCLCLQGLSELHKAFHRSLMGLFQLNRKLCYSPSRMVQSSPLSEFSFFSARKTDENLQHFDSPLKIKQDWSLIIT